MKPIFEEICSIPQRYLDPLIARYGSLTWDEPVYNVANPVFKKVSGQVIVVVAESKVKIVDEDIMSLLDYAFPEAGDRIFRVMVANLQTGRELDWHIDGFEFHFQCWRYHIPLLTNEQCQLEVRTDTGIQTFDMSVGHMFTFNNNIVHRTYNHGTQDRINLIVDVKPEGLTTADADLVKHRYWSMSELKAKQQAVQ